MAAAIASRVSAGAEQPHDEPVGLAVPADDPARFDFTAERDDAIH